jgi:ABC-2 type transport system ATP-binding protein
VEAGIQFNHVCKSFGDVQALQDISFQITEGSIFGLLGPNGAGKTTLIRIITHILAADSGNITFRGQDLNTLGYGFIGYMPEEKGMYKAMKVGEHLVYLGRLKGLKKSVAENRIKYWLNRLDADNWWNKKIQDLSKGMQQKVQFIATVLHEPKLLILDEPFSGLDPVNADLLKDEIFHLHQQGTTILFSTHRMEQVEEICDKIVLIDHGKLIIEGAVRTVKEAFREHLYELETGNQLPTEPNEMFSIIHGESGKYLIRLQDGVTSNTLLRYCLDAGISINGYREILPSLHEVFKKLVQADQHA